MTTPTPTASNFVTFRHLIAGSVFHFQESPPGLKQGESGGPVKTVTFSGKRGELGFYTTDNAFEIEELRKLARNPQVQLEEELPTTAAEPVLSKQLPPEIAKAAEEVQAQAEHAADPAVISAQEKLAAVIAKQKA